MRAGPGIAKNYVRYQSVTSSLRRKPDLDPSEALVEFDRETLAQAQLAQAPIVEQQIQQEGLDDGGHTIRDGRGFQVLGLKQSAADGGATRRDKPNHLLSE